MKIHNPTYLRCRGVSPQFFGRKELEITTTNVGITKSATVGCVYTHIRARSYRW